MKTELLSLVLGVIESLSCCALLASDPSFRLHWTTEPGPEVGGGH
jgi:hypothetical protein